MASHSSLQTAFVLCAGFGTRMGLLTKARPKPLLSVAGSSFLDHILRDLVAAGVPHLIVNTHYLADQVEEALIPWRASFETIHISHEPKILGTGGALACVQPHLATLEGKAFFVVNTDTLFRSPHQIPHGASIFQNLQTYWNSEEDTDVLLTLISAENRQKGDFQMNREKGTLSWPVGGEKAPWIYGGIAVYKTELLEALSPPTPFHASYYWDMALTTGGLKGMVWEGDWFDLGTQEAYEAFHAQAL